jgi:hypothetical protein
MELSIDTQTFFLIILSGFTLVWSFRHFSDSRKEILDFEYLGFSAIWGVLILAGYSWLTRAEPKRLDALIENPPAAGVALSLLAISIGFAAGKISRRFRG